MKTHLVQLETRDDVLAVRDRMAWAQTGRILLIWPRRGRCRLRAMDWVLLRRAGTDLGCQVGLVTRHEVARHEAEQAGIVVFASVQDAQRLAWRQGRKPRRWRWKRDEQRAGRLLSERPRRGNWRDAPVWLRLGVFAFGLLAVLGLLLFFLPQAELHLRPAVIQQSLDLDVWADPRLGFAMVSGGMPARRLEVLVEGRATIAASGTVQAPSSNASGLVILTNLTEEAIYVPTGLVVLTLDDPPVRMQTLRAVTLPAGVGQTTTAAVQSITPGSAGNVAAGAVQAVEGPLGARLLVRNEDVILGGREVLRSAPTEADYATLRQQLLEDLGLQAVEDLQRTLPEGQVLVAGTVNLQAVVSELAQPEAGIPAEEASLTIQAVFEGWSVAQADLQMAASAALDVGLPPGYVADVETLSIVALDEAQKSGDDVWRWPVRVQRTLRGDWSAAQLSVALAGQPLWAVPELVAAQVPLAEPVQVRLTPAWWGRMPVLPIRIFVKEE